MNTDLTNGKISHHLRVLTIPASIGMIFNTLYNIVDTFYAGQIGTATMAGMAVSFPIYFIIIALSSGIGSGSSALSSIAIGSKDSSRLHTLIKNSLYIGVFITILIMIFAPSISKLLFRISGATGKTLSEGTLYMNTLFWGSFFFIMNSILSGILSAQGDTKTYRNALIIGFFINLILDPLFIYGWWIFPVLSTMGIALATVLVQVIVTIYLLIHVYKSALFDLSLFKTAKYSFKVIRELLSQGIPASLNNATTAFGVFIINFYILRFSDPTTMAAYSASMRIEQLALLPALGLNSASLAIAGQNFGAKFYNRIYELRRIAIRAGVTIMIIGGLIIYPLAPQLIGLFNSDIDVINAGTVYLRIEFFAFPTYVILGVLLSILQGIKKPRFAVFIGLYRQILMPIPLFYFLGQVLGMGVRGLWWGVVFLTWSSVIVTALYNNKELKKLSKLKEESDN